MMNIKDKVTELVNKYETMAIDVVCEIIEELTDVQDGYDIDLNQLLSYWERVKKEIKTIH